MQTLRPLSWTLWIAFALCTPLPGCCLQLVSGINPDAGFEPGADAGIDAGADAGIDSGMDAGVDAGGAVGPCGRSSDMSVTVTYPLLEDPSMPDSGMWVTSMVSGDLDGDGLLDLVAMVYSSSFFENYGFGVFFGEPDGGLSEPVFYQGHSFAFSAVTLADVNGDGRLDVLAGAVPRMAGGQDPGVSLYLNDGRGGLTWAGTFPGTVDEDRDRGFTSIGVADLNGDGRADLVLSQWLLPDPQLFSGIVEVLLRSSDGGFAPPWRIDGVRSTLFGGVAVGDLNGDGIADISGVFPDAGIVVLLGQGDGGFARRLQPYFVGPDTGVALLPSAGGPADLLVATPGLDAGGSVPGFLQVLDNAGGPTFLATPAQSGAGYALAVGDFNGDCLPDVATVGQSGSEYDFSSWLAIHYGARNGRLGEPHDLPVVGDFPYGLASLGPVAHPRALAVGDRLGRGITVYGDASR